MEERSYKWFLQALSESQSQLKILETGICRGTNVISWFTNTKSDTVFSKPTKTSTKTKSLLNHFLNIRIPIIEQYSPDRIICFLYHKTGKKLVQAQEAIELAENQLHGLQVTSIHMAISSISQIFMIKASNCENEFSTEILVCKFGQTAQVMKDQSEIGKFINFLVQINELLYKFSNREVHEISMDLTKDQLGSLVLIKITELKFKFVPMQRCLFRRSSIKLITHDSSSEESLTDEEVPVLIRNSTSSYLFKERPSIKVPLKKPQINNIDFLEMIGKTIEKDRKKTYDRLSSVEELEIKNKVSARRTYKESRSVKKSWDSLNDLLFYLEKTRPRVWIKDSGELPATARSSASKEVKKEVRVNTARNFDVAVKNVKVESLFNARPNRLKLHTQPPGVLRKSV